MTVYLENEYPLDNGPREEGRNSIFCTPTKLDSDVVIYLNGRRILLLSLFLVRRVYVLHLGNEWFMQCSYCR